MLCLVSSVCYVSIEYQSKPQFEFDLPLTVQSIYFNCPKLLSNTFLYVLSLEALKYFAYITFQFNFRINSISIKSNIQNASIIKILYFKLRFLYKYVKLIIHFIKNINLFYHIEELVLFTFLKREIEITMSKGMFNKKH